MWLSWERIHLQCGRPGFNPWIGKIPWRRERLPLQYVGLENSMNCIVHRVTKSWTRLSDFWNAKVGSQEIPGVTGKFGLGVQNESGQRLTEFCQENALAIANTLFQQYKRQLYTWTSPAGQYQNHIYYILFRQRWRSSIPSAKTRPGADCGSDYELLIAKFRLKLRKVGKTTRPFKYDLNHIPYQNSPSQASAIREP